MNASLRTLAVAAASLVFTSSLAAQGFDIRDFPRVSDAEILTPAFTNAGGDTTARNYTGFVEFVVSGMGSRLPGQLVDAFYDFTDPTVPSLNGITLRLGSSVQLDTNPLPNLGFVPNCALSFECGSIHVAELAVAYEGPSFPAPGAIANDGLVPEYDNTHEYRLVLDLGTYDGTLTLGNGDGGVSDNFGEYRIEIYDVDFAPVSHLACVGFEPPLDAGPVSVGGAGRLKFVAELVGEAGIPVTDADISALPVAQVIFDSELPGEPPIDVTDQLLGPRRNIRGNQFLYMSEAEKWSHNLLTLDYSAPGTYAVSMVSGDASAYVIEPACEAEYVVE